MELQGLMTTSKNLQSLLPINDDCEHSRITSALPGSSDPEKRATLHRVIGQPQGQPFNDQAIAQLAPQQTFPVSQSKIDYARASVEHLVAAAKSSDKLAFEELSGRYTNSIRSVVYRIVGNREDTEDVVQDSLLKAYCHLSKFRESCSFSTWITQIAINTARMLLRKRKARLEVSLVQSGDIDHTEKMFDCADPSPGTEQRYSRQKTLEFMSCAVDRLPAVYRSVVEQYHAQEKSMQEAADTLGISVASAKSRLFRARRILRSRLQRQRITIFDAC